MLFSQWIKPRASLSASLPYFLLNRHISFKFLNRRPSNLPNGIGSLNIVATKTTLTTNKQ